MSFKRQICRLAVPRQVTDPLWIFDDILNDALSRFTLCKFSRRHGSSIPGPFEARRRAAKRRVMNLASPAGVGLDPSCLPGIITPTGWHWQAPGNSATQEPVPQTEDVTPLPPWLTETQPTKAIEEQPCPGENKPSSVEDLFGTENNPEAKQFASSFYKLRGLRSILGGQKVLESTPSTRKFLNGLKNCKTIEEVQKLVSGLNIELRPASMCSKLTFDHLLRIGSKLGMLMQFLENSNLDAPAARNLGTLVLWHAQQELKEDDERLLHLWVRRQVSKGVFWHAKHISLLLDSLFHINGMIESENNDCRISRCIFQGLSASTVFTIHDVKGSALNVLIGSVTSSSRSETGELLGIEIIKCSSTSQLEKMGTGITSFLKKCLLPKNRDQQVQNFDQNIATKVLDLLQKAPRDIEVKSIAGATSALVECREYACASRSDLLKNLRTWWLSLLNRGLFETLCRNDQWVEVERILALQNIDILATYLLQLKDEEKCCFLLRNWFIPEISGNPLCQLEHADDIEKEFRHELNLPRARLSPFVTMLQTLGPKLQVDSKWISSLFSLLREFGRLSTVLEIASFNQVLGLRISPMAIVREISENAKSQPHVAYRLFKTTPKIPLEACPEVAEIMIQNPRFNPSTALIYHRTRQKFLFILNFLISSEPCSIFSNYKLIRGKNPMILNSRAYLLDRMALAYAQALHLYPGVAFRNASHCHRLHKRYRLGPVSVDMSRALTIAGAIRPLQANKWLSTMQFRRILRVVNEVEGEESAQGINELCYKWRTEVLHATKARKQRQKEIGLEVSQPLRKRLRGKTLAMWIDGRKVGRRGTRGS